MTGNSKPSGIRRRLTAGLGLAAAGGGLLGFALSPTARCWWEALGSAGQTWVLILGGVVVGGGLYRLLPDWRHWRLRPQEAKVNLPGLGEMTLRVDARQREAGWRIFVELATRIATQRLDPRTGLVREALTSLYELFKSIRAELKSMPPASGGGQGVVDIETYALSILNHVLRPFTSRWHPLLKAWEDQGQPETNWPLQDACREDLETTRKAVLEYTRQLGKALDVPRYEELLAEPEGGVAGKLTPLPGPDETLQASLDPQRRQAGWRIYVALESRIAVQPLPADAGLIREALGSLYTAFAEIRKELQELPGPTPGSPPPERSVEGIALAILNRHLRPFLAHWHPRLKAWEEGGKSESDWPEADACRKALDGTREKVAAENARLIDLIR